MNPPQDANSNLTGISKVLSEGSLDIMIHIQQFLEPADILALRLTCKSFSEATRARSVWMNAVHNVCITHGAFLPSFPLKEMSLDDLEHTASSPHRFRDIIQKHSGQESATPLLTRVFVPRIQRQLGGAARQTKIDQMGLIPGGRFLLTSTNSGNLFLWDLGLNAGSHMKLFPIATLDASDGSQGASNLDDFWFDYGPMATSGGIYIVTKFNPTPGVNAKASCYEIYPNSEFPKFSQIGTMAVAGLFTDCGVLSPDYYACDGGSRLVVWKFAADLGLSWNLDDTPDKIYITGANIITFHQDNFLLWKLPDLQALVNDMPAHINHFPKLILGYPSYIDDICNSVSLPSPWLPQEAQKQFGLFNDDSEDSPMILFAIKSIDTSHDTSLPEVLPLRVGSVQCSLNSPHVDYMIMTDSGFLQTSRLPDETDEDTHDEILADLIFTPTPKNPAYSSVSAVLWSGEQSLGDVKDHTICSMTGRIVIKLLRSDDDQRSEVHVMDFLLPRTFL